MKYFQNESIWDAELPEAHIANQSRFKIFLIQLDMKPHNGSSGNKHFFTKQCHRQTYQYYEQPPQTSQKF